MLSILTLQLLSLLTLSLGMTKLVDLSTNNAVGESKSVAKNAARVPCHLAIDPISGEQISVCGDDPDPVDPVSYPDDPYATDFHGGTVEHTCINSGLQINLQSFGISVGDGVRATSPSCNILQSKFEIAYNNNTQYITKIIQSVVQSVDDPSLFAYVYRISMDPKQTRNRGGEDWTVRQAATRVDLNQNGATNALFEVRDYSPKRSSNITSVSIGGGISGSGFSLSAGVTYNHSELTINNKSNTNNSLYDVSYNVDESMTDYNKNEVFFFGMFTFKKSNTAKFRYLNVTHIVNYYGHRSYRDTHKTTYNYTLKLI